jgi:D-3-phosphoglycerate dehydrogenase
MKPKVLLVQEIHEAGVDLLKQEVEVIMPKSTKPEDIKAAIKECAGVIVRNQKLTKDIIEAAPNLKVIGRHGAGFDNIDLQAAADKGLPVVYAPGSNNISVAEGAVGLMLALAKKIPEADNKLKKENDFQFRVRVRTLELNQKTLGLIGFGQIARHVCQICKFGFNMNVITYDKFISPEIPKEYGVKLVDDLDVLLSQSDFVSLHVPSTPETFQLINQETLKKMKKTAFLINTARGPVVDEKALIKALTQKEIAGAGLDVFDPEPPNADNPLFTMNNVVLSPHMCAHTDEGLKRMAVMVVHGVLDVLNDRSPQYVANKHLL